MEYTGQSPLIATRHSHNGRQPARGAAPHACGKYGDHGWQRVYLHAPGTKAVAPLRCPPAAVRYNSIAPYPAPLWPAIP